MLTSSAKSKGRKLQNLVRDTLRNIFINQLENDDITARQMGGAGTDIVTSPAAKKLIIFDIECKNQEKLQVPAALKQAYDNSTPGRIPLLVFKKNKGNVYVALSYDHFMKLIYNADIPAIKKLLEENDKSKKESIPIENCKQQ